MSILQWGMETLVVALLAVTLVRTWRLDRALSLVRSDRSGLEALLAALETNMRQARAGIERLQGLADGAGRRVEQQSQAALTLRDELNVMVDRGERLAERLDQSVRAARAAVLVLEADGGTGAGSSHGLAPQGGHARSTGKAVALAGPIATQNAAGQGAVGQLSSVRGSGGQMRGPLLSGAVVAGGPVAAPTMAGAATSGVASGITAGTSIGGGLPGTSLTVGTRPRSAPAVSLSGGSAPGPVMVNPMLPGPLPPGNGAKDARPARLTAPDPTAGHVSAHGPSSAATSVKTVVERGEDRVRSQAERDLLAVLRAGR